MALLALSLFAGVCGLAWQYEVWLNTRIDTVYRKTTATITEMNLEQSVGTNDAGQLSWVFTPTIAYRYRVGDTAYESDQFTRHAESLSGKPAARNFRNTYGIGETVECLYDPDSPASVVLVKPTEKRAKELKNLSIVLILVGAFGLGIVELLAHAKPRSTRTRAPQSWGEDDATANDPLARTRRLLRESMETPTD